MDTSSKQCMLHFEDLKTTQTLSSCNLKGAKTIQSAKSVYESSSDPTIHEYVQICVAIDQQHGVFQWEGKEYHQACFKKFAKKVLLFLSIYSKYHIVGIIVILPLNG